jgi:hypothetical protein
MSILWAVITQPFEAVCRLNGQTAVHGHHITLALGHFRPEWDDIVGREFEVPVRQECWNQDLGVQALWVELPEALEKFRRPSKEAKALGVPPAHVTLYTLSGVRPVASNRMLVGQMNVAPPHVQSLHVRVEFCQEALMKEQSQKTMIIGGARL